MAKSKRLRKLPEYSTAAATTGKRKAGPPQAKARQRGRPQTKRRTAEPGRSKVESRKTSAMAKRRNQAAGQPGRKTGSRSMARNELTYFILIPTVALLLLGLVMVFSAGSGTAAALGEGGYRYFIQQSAWAALGLLMMAFFARLDYHKLGKISWLCVIASIALLLAVLLFGRVAGGARRWLDLGPFSLQPTEIAKFTMVVFAAWALATKGDNVKKFVHLLVPVGIVALLEALLILRQPDLGSAIVLCLSVFLVIAISRARVSHLVTIGATGGVAAVYFMLSAPYRRARLFSFVNPWKSPRGAGYQVIQSYIALGSGHLKGLGLGMSRQKFLYLPNAHTDFIFAIIGEELGIMGTMLVMSMMGLLVYGGFKIASTAPDELGKLLAAGITGLIVIQALINMGGVTGLMPITGVPLPLVSFGGSSLCVCMGCIGILLNIASQSSR